MRGRSLAYVAGFAALGLLAWRRPFRVLVDGDSMRPTLAPGDQLLCMRSGRIDRGHLVVVRPPSHGFEMVKRVASLPGEILTVEGEERRLGPDEYLVVGDNPEASTDGRSFGPVRRAQIAGVVRLRYLPSPRVLGP
jgi:type IV secretory pathway protease TraF